LISRPVSTAALTVVLLSGAAPVVSVLLGAAAVVAVVAGGGAVVVVAAELPQAASRPASPPAAPTVVWVWSLSMSGIALPFL